MSTASITEQDVTEIRTLRDPDACGAYLDAFPVMKSFSFDLEEIIGDGEHASARGSLQLVVDIDDNDVAMNGKFIDTLSKTVSGWRFKAVMWNT